MILLSVIIQSALVLCLPQAVFEVCRENGLRLVEIGEGVSLDDVRAATGASFQVHTQG